MKVLLLLFCCLSIAITQNNPATSPTEGGQIVLSVGQIFPGRIDVTQSKQNVHNLLVGQLEKKYLFLRVNTYDSVKMAIGLYLNQTRQIVYACQENVFDSCYIPTSLLKQNTMYVILIVTNENMQYNLYSYWGDLEHLKPNQQIKFMFDKKNPTQLFHLQFENQKNFEQIRIILKPETTRSQGDAVKILANIGFKQEPTLQKHDFSSTHVWGQAQAIFLSRQDVKNQTGIAIYIAGSAQTVYLLQCQFVQSKSHSLKVNETLHQYLGKNKQTYYEMNFTENKNVDSFVIKFSIFVGQVEVEFYYDRQLKKPYSKLPYQYMSDMQFNIDKNDFQKGTKQIFMRVRCPDSPAIYQISTQARNKQLAFQLAQNVYQFSALTEPKQAMYFYSHIWDSSTYEELKIYKFDVSTIKIFGFPIFQFYTCKLNSSEEDCKNINDKTFMNHVDKVKPSGIEQVGSKIIHTLQFNKSAYKTLNQVQKRLMIIVLVKNQANGTTAYAAQYSNPNQIRLLRQGRAFEDKVRIQQKKYYKYVNNNPNVTQIRIHINQISGLSKIRAKRQNIRETGGQQISISQDQPDTIVVKERVTEPVYIQVLGLVTTLYTISVSAIHSEHIVSNALIMAEDVQYEVKLLPYQHMNVELHPIQSQIVFEYYSEGGSVMVCQVDARDSCIGEKLAGSHGQIKINAAGSREIRLRIGNYIDTSLLTPNAKKSQNTEHTPELVRKVKLTLIYHAAGMTHCDERKLNKVYSQNVKSGSCFKYHLPLASDIQIMTSRSDLGQTFQMFFLCSKKITPIQSNNRYLVKGDTIRQSCQELPHDIILQMIISDSGKNAPELKMDYSVEYGNDTITLADGVAYVSKGYSNPETALRTFFYEIVDEDRDVNIVLYNQRGIQKFYANVVSKPNRYNGFISEGQAKFSSKTSNYYTNPYIKITPGDIKDANCGRTCVLIISIFSIEKTGTEIEYAIEVTQNHIYLKQDEIKKGYLSKGSVEFYEYESKSSDGSLIFLVSDNNRKCARSLMSRNPFPTSSNYFVKENQGAIIYEKTQKGTYYFAVQAIEDCPYSVTITEGTGRITKIQFGQFYDVKLNEGEGKWFYTRRISKSTFKIITLKKYGEVDIFVNQTSLTKQAIQQIEKKQVDKTKFAFKSSYKNTLVIDSKSKQFCHDCYYLINVQAKKSMEGSIYLGADNSKILMSEDKILFDQISQKNSTTYATFYRVSPGKLQVKVHTGKVKFEMSYSSQKFSKSFPQNKKVYHEDYNFTKQQGNFQPIQIRVTAQSVPALYSFELTPTSDASASTHKINPGEHTYVFLKKGEQQCLTGTLTGSQQEIYITTQPSQAQLLNYLVLNTTLDNNTAAVEQDLVGNILSLKFKHESVLFTKAKNYSICISFENLNETSNKSNLQRSQKQPKSFSSSISLFAFQNENVNLIHPDTEVLVKKQSTFVLYSNSDVIVDLFECEGRAEINYGSNLQKIKQKQSHKLDTIGIAGQNHAIRISQYSTLYFTIKAKLATVLWMPLVEKEERGIGYYKYAIGGLEYHSRFNNIQFRIGGLYRAKETETQVKNVKYTLYISNTKQLLQQAVMCEKNAKSKFVFASVNTSTVGNRTAKEVSITMDKKSITDTFSENQTLYFNVVADLTLEPPKKKSSQQQQQSSGDNHQHYRFIYNDQIVPSEVFRQNKIQSMQLTLLIVLAVVTVVGFVLVSCIFVKCIVPALGRLKNRVLVEEKEDPKDQSIPIPPSSDRGHRETGAPGTEDKMND